MSVTLNHTIDGFAYGEAVEGWTAQLGENATARRTLYVAFTDAPQVALHLLGTSYYNGQGQLIMSARKRHPLLSNLWVSEVGIKPVGKPLGESRWEYAELDVAYKTFPYNPESESQDLSEVQVDVAGDIVQLNRNGVEFDNEESDPANRIVDNDSPVLVSYLNITQTFHRVTLLPLSAMYTLFNTVNNATVTFDCGNGVTQSFDAGYVLYCGGSASQKTTSEGISHWTVSHKFLVSSRDHREEFNPRTGQWEKVKTKGGSDYKYGEGDFSLII
jgi:hypothetical protein